jgi:hypothetical protein
VPPGLGLGLGVLVVVMGLAFAAVQIRDCRQANAAAPTEQR